MVEPLQVVRLENGLTVNFHDQSNRYFGDFHRLCIRVEIVLPLDSADLPKALLDEVAKLKQPLCFEKKLERMGVPTAELEATRAALIEDFLGTATSYLNHPEFVLRTVRKKLQENKRPLFLRCF